jgi:hypothetical protein
MTSRPVFVRRASASDLPLIEALQVRVYREEGYLSAARPHSMGDEAPFNDPHLTDVFVAFQHTPEGTEELVGTISLTEEGPDGFPTFTGDFPHAMRVLKAHDGKLCVLWRFIVVPNCRTNFRAAMLLIMESLIAGRARGIVRAICAVNPTKHELFYRDRLGFCEIARCANVSGLVHAPAVLLFAYVRDLEGRKHPLVRKMTVLYEESAPLAA